MKITYSTPTWAKKHFQHQYSPVLKGIRLGWFLHLVQSISDMGSPGLVEIFSTQSSRTFMRFYTTPLMTTSFTGSYCWKELFFFFREVVDDFA